MIFGPEPMRFAYADPPYVGCSSYYDHPDSARWDDPAEHVALMHAMEAEYDGWALSLSTPSLAALLPGAPEGTRIGSWVKPFAAFKRNVRVAYTWEPVLFHRIAPDATVNRSDVTTWPRRSPCAAGSPVPSPSGSATGCASCSATGKATSWSTCSPARARSARRSTG